MLGAAQSIQLHQVDGRLPAADGAGTGTAGAPFRFKKLPVASLGAAVTGPVAVAGCAAGALAGEPVGLLTDMYWLLR